MSHREVCLYSYFWLCGYLWAPLVSFVMADESSVSFTNIQVLHSNFVECKSFRESDSPDILALCVTNLDDAIDSGNFSLRGYLPLIQKDDITHMHGFPVYVEEGLSFYMGPISRKLCRFLLMFSTDFISLSVFFLFPLLITFVVMHNFWFYFI